MIETATALVTSLGYVGIFLLMCVETIFPPLPSEIIMPFAGFTAAKGSLNIFGFIAAGILGSLTGAFGLYGVGKLLKEEHIEAFLTKRGKTIGLTKKDLHASQRWFDRHGYLAVFLCRLLPGIRSLISLPAGMRSMKLLPFLGYSLIGTTIWTALLAGGGYFLGEEYHRIEDQIEPLSWIVIGILAVGLLWLLTKRLKANNSDQS